MGNGTIGKNLSSVDQAVLEQAKNVVDPAATTQIESIEQPSELHGDDTFAVTGSEERADASQTSPERSLAEGGTPVRGERAVEPGTKTIAVKAGESWADVLGEHYGSPVSPELIAVVAQLNGTSPTDSPPDVLTLYGTEQIYRVMHPNDDRKFLEKAEYITVQPGTEWTDLARQHFGADTPDQAVRALAFILRRANGSEGRLSKPLPVVVVPSNQDLTTLLAHLAREARHFSAAASGATATDANAKRPVPPRVANLYREAGGEMVQLQQGETLRDLVIRQYHSHIMEQGLNSEQAAEQLSDYMLLIAGVNNLRSTNLDGYEAIWLPPVERLDSRRQMLRGDGRLQRWRAGRRPMVQAIVSQGRGALADAHAFRDGLYRNAGPDRVGNTGAGAAPGATLEQIQGALSIIRARHLQQRTEQYGYVVPFIGVSIGAMIGAAEVAVAMQAATADRGETETITDYVDRTTQHLSAEDRAIKLLMVEKVSMRVEQLRSYGLIDAAGFLTLEITDPKMIALRIYERTAGSGIDYAARAELINNLRTYAATRVGADGMLTGKLDVMEAYLEAGAKDDAWSTSDEGAGGSDWKDEAQTAFADKGMKYEPEDTGEEAIDKGSATTDELDKLTGELVALVESRGIDFNQLTAKFREELMANMRREAEALALLKLDVREFDEVVKFAAVQISADLAAGRSFGGTPTESQINK